MSLPIVLLVSLEKDPSYDEKHAKMLTALRARSDLREATSADSALKYFSESIHIAAIIVTQFNVLESKFYYVASNIKQYAINGGTVIFGALCSHVADPGDLSTSFRRMFTLPWTFALVPVTAVFVLNPKVADDRFKHPSMPNIYAMTALCVASPDLKREQLVYVDSMIGLVSPPRSPLKLGTAPISSDGERKKLYAGPVVFRTYGQGYLGWIGDIGTISTSVLFAMCGLNGIVAQGESNRKEQLDRDTRGNLQRQF